jgi:hypothetical protein
MREPTWMLTARPATVLGVEGIARWLHAHRGAAGVAGLVSFAGPATFFAGAVSVMESPNAAAVVALLASFMVYGALLWLLLLIGGYVYWRLRPQGWAAGAAVAVVLASVAVTAADTATAERRHQINIEQGVVASRVTMQLYSATFSLAMALLFFAHLRVGRSHERAAERLAAAQAAQRALRRRAVARQLAAVQARIDPKLLFDMLDEVRRCYERDAVRAERLLDELVVFLRAALPRLRSQSSSVAREAELARAYVRLRSLAGAGDLGPAFNVTPAAANARFPPGVLLPLLDDVLGRVRGPCGLSATRIGSDCRIVVTLPQAPAPATLDRVRALLDELYAPAASLSCEGESGGEASVRISVPHEPA